MKPVGVGRAGRKPQVPRSSAKRQLGSGHGALAGESCQTLAGAAPKPSKGADKRLEQDQENWETGSSRPVWEMLSCREVPSPAAILGASSLVSLNYFIQEGGEDIRWGPLS